MRKKTGFILALILMLIMSAMTAYAKSDDNESAASRKKVRETETYITHEEGGLSFQIPDYYSEKPKEGSDTSYSVNEKNGLALIQFLHTYGSFTDDDFSEKSNALYDDYLSGLKKADDVSSIKKGDSREFIINCGLKARIYSSTFMMADVKCNSLLTILNNTDSDTVVYSIYTQKGDTDYDYETAYETLLTNAEPVSENTSGAASSGNESLDVTPEFKELMDNHEEFFDHYCDVMRKYKDDPTDKDIIIEMTNLLPEMKENRTEIDNLDRSELSIGDRAYLQEVTIRIAKKMAELESYLRQ